jgi:hypothetical protein
MSEVDIAHTVVFEPCNDIFRKEQYYGAQTFYLLDLPGRQVALKFVGDFVFLLDQVYWLLYAHEYPQQVQAYYKEQTK